MDFRDACADMLFENVLYTFKMLSTCEECLSLLRQHCSQRAVHGPLKGALGVDSDAFDCLQNVDDALPYIKYLLFKPLNYIILNHDLCVQSKE